MRICRRNSDIDLRFFSVGFLGGFFCLRGWGAKLKYFNPTGLICIEKTEKSKKVKVGVGRGQNGKFLRMGRKGG